MKIEPQNLTGWPSTSLLPVTQRSPNGLLTALQNDLAASPLEDVFFVPVILRSDDAVSLFAERSLCIHDGHDCFLVSAGL